MNTEELMKIDIFNFGYNEFEENRMGYTVGTSIIDQSERFVANVSLNPNTDDFLESFRQLLRFSSSIDVRTLGIDYRLLTNETVQYLKEAYEDGLISGIRITPDNYVLTNNVAQMFNDEAFRNFIIAVDYVENGVQTDALETDVRVQEGICKIEKIIYQKGTEIHDNTNIHLTKKLNSNEIARLTNMIRNGSYQNIILDFYDPGYYRDFLTELSYANIPEEVEIRLLANPLYDQTECFTDLNKILPNKIRVLYNTCNDLNESYTEEPYTEGARYYSDIEASGETTLDNYCEMVKMIDEIVSHMEKEKYSPLEMIAYVHDYFKENFIYDPDFETVAHSENADLDKVFKKDRMVCEGFSNLYSAILRRAGVLCFTYGTDNHQKNIVRVKDEKYGVDSIALIDPTNDLAIDNNKNNFQHFLLPIDNDLYASEAEVISIPTSLTMASPDYYAYIGNSNPVYATDPLGYGIRMLQLMGLTHGDRQFQTEMELQEFYKTALANSYLTDKIPYDKIVGAVQKVRDKEHKYSTQQEEYEDHDEISNALQTRGNSYYIAPAIKLWGPPEATVDVDLYAARINNYDIRFTNSKDQPSQYQKPRRKNENETIEEYRNYLKEYYDKTFYHRENEVQEGEKNMEEVQEEIKEYEVDSTPVSEIVMYRDIEDSGRIFVSKSVFDRFHLIPPRYEVTIGEDEVVYELSPGAAVDILNNANNAYSPYIIRFVYIELEEKIIPYDENVSKLDDKGELKDTQDEVIPYNNAVSILDSNAGYKNVDNVIMPVEDQVVEQAEQKQVNQDDNLIPGTDLQKPRPRGIKETEEEYVKYLEGYYDGIFGEKNQTEDKPIFDLLNDNLIPGTNFEKPRVRGIYESDEEYVAYLEEYYNSIFQGETQEEVTSRRR